MSIIIFPTQERNIKEMLRVNGFRLIAYRRLPIDMQLGDEIFAYYLPETGARKFYSMTLFTGKSGWGKEMWAFPSPTRSRLSVYHTLLEFSQGKYCHPITLLEPLESLFSEKERQKAAEGGEA